MQRSPFIFSVFALLSLFTPLLLTLLLVATVPAFAQEAMRAPASTTGQKQATPATPHHEKPTASTSKPQIITDEKTNTVRVLIGGKEVLAIDAQGLHVRRDIEYGGFLTDYGDSGFEKVLEHERKEGSAR